MADVQDNVFNASLARSAPKLKLWRYAGLMLTYRCNAACRFCYYYCSPQAAGLMPTEMAVAAWTALRRLAGGHARVHLTGGEPFLVFDRLLDICHEAQRQGLGGADYVETNAGWVTDEAEARYRLKSLKAAGLMRLKISCDIFHQEFVPFEKVQFLALAAREILGSEHVLVRWEKHLENPLDAAAMEPSVRGMAMVQAMAEEAGRFTGRAAEQLAPLCADKSCGQLAALNCRNAILGAKGVHIDPYGNVFSGQCSGMAVGTLRTAELDDLWKTFDPRAQAFWGTLVGRGPAGFLEQACSEGYRPRPLYASKCHLCADIRSFYFDKGLFLPIICPSECYGRPSPQGHSNRLLWDVFNAGRG